MRLWTLQRACDIQVARAALGPAIADRAPVDIALGRIAANQVIGAAVSGQGAADPRELERGERALVQFATVLDDHLRGRVWVAGKAISLADLALAPAMSYLKPGRLPLAPFKNIQRWFEQIEATQAWQQTDVPWPQE